MSPRCYGFFFLPKFGFFFLPILGLVGMALSESGSTLWVLLTFIVMIIIGLAVCELPTQVIIYVLIKNAMSISCKPGKSDEREPTVEQQLHLLSPPSSDEARQHRVALHLVLVREPLTQIPLLVPRPRPHPVDAGQDEYHDEQVAADEDDADPGQHLEHVVGRRDEAATAAARDPLLRGAGPPQAG